MIDISKVTRGDMLTLPKIKDKLLEERAEWLEKQRKKDKLKVRNAHERTLRKLGYESTRDLQSITITISKCDHIIFTVRELKSGEIKVYDRFYQFEWKRKK